MSSSRRSNVMLKTGSSSHRWFLGALVIAVTLPSCGRGADTRPPGNGAAADTAAPAQPAAPAPAPPPAPPRELTWSGKVDMALWSSVPGEGLPRCPAAEHAAHARDPAHPEPQARGAGLRRHDRRGARPRGRPDRRHGPARDDGERRHRGPPRRVLPGAQGSQGRRCPGAGHARRSRAIPGGVDPRSPLRTTSA